MNDLNENEFLLTLNGKTFDELHQMLIKLNRIDNSRMYCLISRKIEIEYPTEYNNQIRVQPSSKNAIGSCFQTLIIFHGGFVSVILFLVIFNQTNFNLLSLAIPGIFLSHYRIAYVAFRENYGYGLLCLMLGWVGPLIFAIEHFKKIKYSLILLYISTAIVFGPIYFNMYKFYITNP